MRIVRQALYLEVADRLRAMIDDRSLAPGAWIDEVALATLLGTSRTPMREALKVLAAEGHVELLPNRGARVRELSLEEVEGLFAVAGALEALAGEQAAARVTDAQLAEITALHERMRDAFAARDMASYYALNRGIHETIVQATRNPVLLDQYALINARIRRIRFNSPMTPEIWSRAMAEHEGMLNALARRDAASLSGILKTHLKHKCEAILEGMKATADAAAAQATGSQRRKAG